MPEQCLHHDENDSGQMRDSSVKVHVRYARQVCRLAGSDVACYGELW